MKTEQTDEEAVFEDIQNTRHSHRTPYIRPEKRALLRNLSRLAGIQERTRFLQDQIREHPLDFFSILVWEVELEKLAFQEEKLLKRNEKLHKALGNERVEIHQVHISAPKEPYNPNTPYAPINLPMLKINADIKVTEQQLQKVYDRKDALFLEIQHSPTCVADERVKNELDQVTRQEASLVSKLEELRLEKENARSQTKLKSKEEKALEEIKEIRNGKDTAAKSITTDKAHYTSRVTDEPEAISEASGQVTQDIEDDPELDDFDKPDFEMSEADDLDIDEWETLDDLEDLRESQEQDMDIDDHDDWDR